MIPGSRRRRAPAISLALFGITMALITGCAGAPGSDPGAPGSPGGAEPSLPAGAIRVGDDLYQVPIGADADGCPMFRLYSPNRMVTQAISYRHRDGGFTMDKRKAACEPGSSGTPRISAFA